MRCREYSAEELREQDLRDKKQAAYVAVCPPMNRAERRTARGRMLVAQAEAAALRAEVEYLREEARLLAYPDLSRVDAYDARPPSSRRRR